jgi:ribosome-associated protein
MYGGAGARTNFAAEAAEAWVPPALAGGGALLGGGRGAVADAPGVPLTPADVEAVLRAERGLDVRVLPLAGRSDLAEHMVWVTGRDARHMGRMADALARVLRRRALPGVDATVEARDMDDWMVVDAGNIIVNIMDADARECFALEPMYEAMVEGVDPHAGMTYDEWLEANPIPQKWLDRLARDEEEMDAAARARKGEAPPRAERAAAAAAEERAARARRPADDRANRATTRDRAFKAKGGGGGGARR